MSESRGLPQYTRSVPLEITQQPNAEAAAGNLINAFQNFGDTVNKVTNAVTKDQAEQQRDIIKNNISNSYKKFTLEALKNPDQNAGLAGYIDQSKNYAKQLLAQTDKYNKPYVSNLIDYYHNEHHYTIEKNAITQNQRALSVDAYERVNNATRDWEDAINNSKPMIDENGEDHQFTAARTLFTDQLRNMDSYARQGFLDKAVVGKGRESLIKKYTTTEYLKRYQDHVEAGQGNQFIAELQKPQNNIPGMSIEEKYNVIGQMIKIRDQGLSGARTAISHLTTARKDDLRNVANGGFPNAELQNELDSLDPSVGEAHQTQVQVQQAVYANTSAATFKSPEEKQQLKEELGKIDYNEPNSANKDRVKVASINAINKQDQQMRADPMTYVLKDKSINDTINTYQQAFNADAVGQDHKYTPFNSQVPKPWDAIIEKQQHLGLTLNGKGGNTTGQGGTSVRLLQSAEVPKIINDVTSAQPIDKLIYMNRLKDQYGYGLPFNLVMKQLTASGLPANYALMASIDPNSVDAEKVANALSLPAAEVAKDVKTKLPTAEKYINSASVQHLYANGVGNQNFQAFLKSQARYGDALDVQTRDALSGSIKQVANYYALVEGLSANQAVDKAESIIADRYHYTTIVDSTVRLPHDVTESAVQTYSAQQERKVKDFPFNYRGHDEARAKRLIQHGHWVNDTVDNGLVWADANGMLWTDSNGHPFGFSFNDASLGHETAIKPKPQLEKPAVQQTVDSGITPDQQEKDIDRIGKQRIAAGKIAGKKFHSLYENIQKGNP